MNYRYFLFLGLAVQLSYGMDAFNEIKSNDDKCNNKREIHDKEFICDYFACEGFSCKEAWELAHHQQNKHGCRVDWKHLKKQKGKASLFCKVCKKTVEYAREEGEMKYHLETVHNFCMACDEICPEGVSLFNHVKSKHPEQIKPIIED